MFYMKIMLMLVFVAHAVYAGDNDLEPPEPTEAARRVADKIRTEVLLPPDGSQGRPLPLASHWNTGRVDGTFEPAHQVDLMQQGSYILPWMATPSGNPQSERFSRYYKPFLAYLSELNMPFSMRGTQWEAILYGGQYREKPDDQWAGVIKPDGSRKPVVSPFGPIDMWKEPANEFVRTDAMRWAQQYYPDPPLVLWVGNNEAGDLRWHQAHESKRYLEKYGEDRSDAFKRRVVSEGWKERYGVMFESMREAMENETWRENVRFVGYGSFGPSHLGRMGQWKNYSLHTEDEMTWDWHVWDGGSPSYYTHNWNTNRDHWVHSTQIQSMNWIFMLEQAWEANPDFWFEISTWDGNNLESLMAGVGLEEQWSAMRHQGEYPDKAELLLVDKLSRPFDEEQQKQIGDDALRKSQTLQYMREGQTYPPERALGWIQYGMWLLRPRVVREFRGSTTLLIPVKQYWMQTVRAVDRVWENETLEEFWRFGELVPNTQQKHPYQANIPEYLQDVQRWYLLETDLDPERPWDHKTNIPVFSLALVIQEEGPEHDRQPMMRQWLLYAHSPLEDRNDVRITIPEYGEVEVDVPRSGAFYLIEEASGGIEEITGKR